MEQQVTREVLTITTLNPSAADKAVGARFNQVAMKALDRADIYLTHGPENYRLAITKAFLGAISRLSAADAEEHISLARQSVQRMFTDIRNVEPNDTDTETLTVGTYDQDDDND
jgi:hypothetical protein